MGRVPMKRRDGTEAVVNAAVGLAVSWGAVEALRALGVWNTHALAVAAVFFVLSVARSYALRRVFRRGE